MTKRRAEVHESRRYSRGVGTPNLDIKQSQQLMDSRRRAAREKAAGGFGVWRVSTHGV